MINPSFRKAEKRRQLLRLALDGPSGSGKTFSALRLAKGICQHLGGNARIAVIDTERGSSELYADRFDFDVLPLSPPHDPRRYVEAIRAAEQEGYQVVLIDSISHAWSGTGGLLDIKDRMAKGSRGGDFGAWRHVTPLHNGFVDAMLDCKAHMIATLRTKSAYEVEKDEKTGKTKVRKIGMKPEQREGVEYEFTLVLDLYLPDHLADTSKDRTGLLDPRPPFLIDEALGVELAAWLGQGAEPAPRPSPPRQSNGAQQGQRYDSQLPAQNNNSQPTSKIAQLYSWARAKGISDDTWCKLCSGVGITRDLLEHPVLLSALDIELRTWVRAQVEMAAAHRDPEQPPVDQPAPVPLPGNNTPTPLDDPEQPPEQLRLGQEPFTEPPPAQTGPAYCLDELRAASVGAGMGPSDWRDLCLELEITNWTRSQKKFVELAGRIDAWAQGARA